MLNATYVYLLSLVCRDVCPEISCQEEASDVIIKDSSPEICEEREGDCTSH